MSLKVATKGLEGAYKVLSRSLVLPGDYTPPRWAAIFNREPTAVAKLNLVYPVPENTTNNTSNTIAAANSFLIMRRDAECACIMYHTAHGTLNSTYSFYGADQTDATAVIAPSTSWTIVNNISMNPGNTLFPIGNFYAMATSAYQPHGPMWFGAMLEDDGSRWFWFDAGTIFNCTATVTVTSGTLSGLSITLDQYVGGTYNAEVENTTGAGPALVGSFTIGKSGYYRARAILNVGAQGLMTLTISNCNYTLPSLKDCFAHRALPDLNANVGNIAACRILAASVLYTNSSPELDLQGMIAGFQIPVGQNWTDFINADTYKNLTSQYDGVATLVAKNGMYGWLKPADVGDFKMRTNLVVRNGILVDSRWRLNTESSSMLITTSIADFSGRQAQYTLSWGVEYTSNSKWIMKESPPKDQQMQNEAIMHCVDIVQFTENPLHLSKIWNNIKHIGKEVADGILKYGPKVLEYAGAAAAAL